VDDRAPGIRARRQLLYRLDVSTEGARAQGVTLVTGAAAVMRRGIARFTVRTRDLGFIVVLVCEDEAEGRLTRG